MGMGTWGLGDAGLCVCMDLISHSGTLKKLATVNSYDCALLSISYRALHDLEPIVIIMIRFNLHDMWVILLASVKFNDFHRFA